MQLICLAMLLAVPVGAWAQAAPSTIVVAIYAPNAPFAGANDRYAYVQRLASHIGNVAQVQAKGTAFARAGDFAAAMRKKKVDFAIVDPVYLAGRGDLRIIATATTGGKTSQSWGLFVKGSVPNVLALKGKRLAYARASGKDTAFLQNALLDGELNFAKFFSARQATPDIASAVAAVSLGRADCVLAPAGRAKGLRRIFNAGTVPNPGFAQVNKSLPGSIVARVTKAVLGFGAGGALDGWRAAGGNVYRGLAGQMGARSRKAAMSEPDLLRLESKEVLLLGKLEPVLPPLKHYFWTP